MPVPPTHQVNVYQEKVRQILGNFLRHPVECHIPVNRKNDLILIMTPEKQDKTLELSKHWSADSTPARNEVIMITTYPVKSVKCDKICCNYQMYAVMRNRTSR